LTNTSNSQHYLQWDDVKDGSGLCTGDITVSVTDSQGNPVNDWTGITGWGSAYTNPVYFSTTPSGGNPLTVTVTCKTPGTFRIRGWSVGSPANTLS
jgi:hypothetical protein